MCKETSTKRSRFIWESYRTEVIEGITQYDYRQIIKALAVMETVIDVNSQNNCLNMKDKGYK